MKDWVEVVIDPKCRESWKAYERDQQMIETREPELKMPMATWHLHDTHEVTQEQHFKSESFLLLRNYSLRLLSKCIKKVIEALREAPTANEEVVYVESQKTYSQF